MNSNFPRIITQLRKERKLSQKEAARELDISQSLLSHYERGIRECNLDFLVKIADYYEVSTDYLLGRTTQRYSDIYMLDEESKDKKYLKTTQVANRRLLTDTISLLFEYLMKVNSKKLSNQISSYLMLAVYKMFRLIYSSNRNNPETNIFTVNKNIFKGFTSAAMQIISSKIDVATNSDLPEEYITGCSELKINPEIISKEYPDISQSAFNLISHSETILRSTIKKQ